VICDLLEGLEYLFDLLSRDADARIFDREHQISVRVNDRVDLYMTPWFRELNRIGQQV